MSVEVVRICVYTAKAPDMHLTAVPVCVFGVKPIALSRIETPRPPRVLVGLRLRDGRFKQQERVAVGVVPHLFDEARVINTDYVLNGDGGLCEVSRDGHP